MRLNFAGQIYIEVRTLAEASWRAIMMGHAAVLEDEGEVLATVSAHGHVYDVAGRVVPLHTLRRVA